MTERPVADEYFNRSVRVVSGTPYCDKVVRYCVFARRGGVLSGLDRAVAFIQDQCAGPLRIAAGRDGDPFEPNEVVMIVEGRFGELVNLETTYLGMLALSGAAGNMAAIVKAAGGIPVVDMSPRHYPHEIIGQIACEIGRAHV